ncbi:hypothetical protein [Sphingomonas sp. 1185]|uniref:phage tail terminator protein n=1 Tax=Sphingomonas sp. 1185 TaxID=3156411 RepID=UPI003396DA6A
MLTLAPIVALLRTGFKSVDGVLEAPSQSDLPRALPALFVVPAADAAEPNTLSGKRDQRVTFDFSVLVTVAARAAQGQVSDELKAVEDRVIELVVGWTHPDASGPVDYVGGRLANVGLGSVTWEVRLRCPYRLRSSH